MTPPDALIGILAVEAELLSEEQHKSAIVEWQSQPTLLLADILLRRKLVTWDDLQTITRRHSLFACPALARYEVIASLGQGATSVVYHARDRQLGRHVALKILRDTLGAIPSLRQRFLRESRISASLSHPNLVATFDAGEAEGRLFLVMEIVEGRPLTDLIEGPECIRTVLPLIAKACHAVGFAHSKGIVHRDLKPANILVTAAGEPKVADFGLARPLDGDEALTQTGATIGTPLYMAPEQVRGHGREAAPSADVYSLGAILYEAATGRPPFLGASIAEIYARVVRDDAVAPRSLAPGLPIDVETIIQKCLNKDPRRRYPTARELAEDLDRHLQGRPIDARRRSTLSIAVKKIREWRTPVIVLAAVILAVVTVVVVGALQRAGRVGELVRSGQGMEAAGRLEEARDAFRSAVELAPESPDAAAALQRCEAALLRLRTLAKARDEAYRLLETRRIELDKTTLLLYRADSDGADIRRRADGLEPSVREAVEKAPDLALGHYLLGRVHDLQGLPERAEVEFRRAIASDPAFAPAHFEVGRILVERSFLEVLNIGSGWDRASDILTEALQALEAAMTAGRDFDDPVLRAGATAFLAYVREEKNDALRQAESAIASYRDKPGIEHLYWLKGAISPDETAIEPLDLALAIRPKSPLILFTRAYRLAQQGLQERAIADYSDAIRTRPHFPEAFFGRGSAHAEAGDHVRALADYGEAIRLRPEFSVAFYNRAISRGTTRDIDGAFADYDEAIRISPRFAAAYVRRGDLLNEINKYAAAIADCDKALAINPGIAGAYNTRGVAYLFLRDYDRAIESCTKGLERKPDLLLLYRTRFAARKAKGDLRGAIEDLDQAIRLDPKDFQYFANRAQLRRRLKEYTAELADLEAALERAPEKWHEELRGLIAQSRRSLGK